MSLISINATSVLLGGPFYSSCERPRPLPLIWINTARMGKPKAPNA